MPALGTILSTKIIFPRTTITATPGATVTLTVVSGEDHIAAWTAGQNESVVISGSHVLGQQLVCLIANDATLPRTITFSTGFLSLGTIIGTTSKTASIKFVSNGTNFIEISRTLGL